MNSSPIDPMNPYSIEVSFNPHGLKALLVDNNHTSIFLTSKMLQSCHYQVTQCTHPTEALMLLRSGEFKFDIVITEVNFSPDMNGIKFLEIVTRETDLPVVIVSAEDRIDIMIEYITEGACAYLPKPIRMEAVRVLWQHVARKELFGLKQIDNVEDGEPNSSHSGEDNKEFCGSSDGVQMEDECITVRGKKNRLVWTNDLHQKFVDAVEQLGIRNAVPKKVLELMNVPGLRRGNVASHLQKYRLNLGKMTAYMQESFTGPNSSTSISIGASGSMIEHDGSCQRTPRGMDQS